MYIIIKADEAEQIQIKNGNNKAHYFFADNIADAKNCLYEIEDTNNFEYWSKFYVNKHLKSCEEFNKYLRKTILDTNHLSRKEITELCFEFLEFCPIKLNKIPEIIIDNNAEINILNYDKEYRFYEQRKKLLYIVDKYTQTKNNIYDWDIPDTEINPIQDLKLILPIKNIKNIFKYSACGALNMKFYKLMYYIDCLDIYIPDRNLRNFWNFYKKSMGVYALQYNKNNNQILVVPKPDELYVKNDITHCSYGELDHYCDGLKVPYWLYNSEPEDLDIKEFEKIKNIDHRSIFIKKIGISKFIDKGEVIDSWENYPDNEWWAKSEYKLVDMKDFFIQKQIIDKRLRRTTYKKYDYAPFLCMKNQTTGEYHLEGVSPDCRNLYDALRMRYKNLDLPSFEIKNIK